MPFALSVVPFPFAVKARTPSSRHVDVFATLGDDGAMPNGKPGDHALTDIAVHGLDVFDARADASSVSYSNVAASANCLTASIFLP